MDAPILFRWEGDAMRPAGARNAKACDDVFVVGELYRLVEANDRSMRSHNHYFAALNDTWLSLPEHQTERFPTVEHLRKWCLIRAGYSDSRQIVCASKAEAQRVAAFIRPMDEYAVITFAEAVVTVWTAQSQSLKAMGKAEFQKSKDAVLEIAAGLIGVTAPELRREAGMAA